MRNPADHHVLLPEFVALTHVKVLQDVNQVVEHSNLLVSALVERAL